MTNLKKKVGLVSLGCPKNLVDSEIMLGLLRNASFEITNNKDEAHILIVNTCGFIESAKKESIDTILEMADCKKNKCELLIVAGCLAERYRHDIMENIPEVDAVIGTGSYADIVQAIEKSYSSGKVEIFRENNSTSYLENERVMTSDNGYAYLKIAEGCNNSCTYCVIPSIRGRYRSRRIGDIEREAAALAKNGRKEIILVSQDTTRYGTDIYNKRSLVTLIKKLSRIKNIEWIRLLYCYPEEISGDLIQELKNNSRLCKYVDIPIQHISDKVLKSMGRRGNKGDIEKLIISLRKEIPGIIIRTSLIVGFPGESEEDFKSLYDFVKTMEFDRLGVFPYSREEGTSAANMKNQVPKKTRDKRYKSIMSLQNSINERKNRERLNLKHSIIVEGYSEESAMYYGRTYGEAPDIDWLVFFRSDKALGIGDITEAEILDVQ